jgi:CheY-like chemotaxis protein
MRRPVILAVDDDADVLHAVERDLRRRYGEQYRIMGADSGQSALEIVRQLKLRGDVVSLFLVDQRMTGVEFLAKGIKDFPRAHDGGGASARVEQPDQCRSPVGLRIAHRGGADPDLCLPLELRTLERAMGETHRHGEKGGSGKRTTA